MLQDVARHSHLCHATGRPIQPGEEYFSALVETVTGSQRWDFSLEGWSGPPVGTIGFWRGKLPEPVAAPVKQEVPIETLLECFDRFQADKDSLDERERRLRYMLALLLVRKRALKLHSIRPDGNVSYLVVRRPPKGELIEVLDPGVDEAALVELERDLHAWMAEQAGPSWAN